MIPTEDETWQIAADKCLLLPVCEAAIVLPLSHGPRRVPKSPPCVEWQESATDSISSRTAYRGWSGLLSGVSVRAGLPGTPLGRSSGTPVPLVTPSSHGCKLPRPCVLSHPDFSSLHMYWEENSNIFLTCLFSHPVLWNYCFSSFAGCSSWKQQLNFSEN